MPKTDRVSQIAQSRYRDWHLSTNFRVIQQLVHNHHISNRLGNGINQHLMNKNILRRRLHKLAAELPQDRHRYITITRQRQQHKLIRQACIPVKMSICCSLAYFSSCTSTVTNEPARPTPALQCTTIGPLSLLPARYPRTYVVDSMIDHA